MKEANLQICEARIFGESVFISSNIDMSYDWPSFLRLPPELRFSYLYSNCDGEILCLMLLRDFAELLI